MTLAVGSWYSRQTPEARAAYIARCNARVKAHRPEARAATRKSYWKNIEQNRERGAEYKRQEWQRLGTGRHADRVEQWTKFISGFNEEERGVVVQLMLCLADFDYGTASVVKDASFDYNWIAAYAGV